MTVKYSFLTSFRFLTAMLKHLLGDPKGNRKCIILSVTFIVAELYNRGQKLASVFLLSYFFGLYSAQPNLKAQLNRKTMTQASISSTLFKSKDHGTDVRPTRREKRQVSAQCLEYLIRNKECLPFTQSTHVGNLVHKHNSIKFYVVVKRPTTKYIQII